MDLQDTASFRLGWISFLAGLLGIVAGLAAFILLKLIGLLSNLFYFQRIAWEIPDLAVHHLGFWAVGIPILGGLIVGFMAHFGSDKIRGHGIPEAMEAVLIKRSRIDPKVAVLKPLSVAIAIGSGGPFGAEGPIIQTGGALGSMVGQWLHITAAERKVLLATGAAAGMAAVFNTPIAAVILAIELLLFEFTARSFIPLVIASTLATAVHGQLLGHDPLFHFTSTGYGTPAALPLYALLGVLCGLLAVGISKALYWIEDLFEHVPLNPLYLPALGGLGLGLIGLAVPHVLGVGYETIQGILSDRFSLAMVLTLLVAKTAAMLISLGSGTSGGLLAPMFTSGAALGAAFGMLVQLAFPQLGLAPAVCALAAMAAVFGAASRATFTFILFAFEITRDYNTILPLMLVCVIASGIARIFMQHSIMTEKLARRGVRVHQDYEVDVFKQVHVRDVMDPQPQTVEAHDLVRDVAEIFQHPNPDSTIHQGLPILDAGTLVGIVTRNDILAALEEDRSGSRAVREVGSQRLIVAYADETLHDATLTMFRNRIGRLPIVDRHHPTILVGYVGRAELLNARLRLLDDEHRREPGWRSTRTSTA